MKKFISGLIIGIMIASAATAFAATLKIKSAVFNPAVKLQVNGKVINTNIATITPEGQVNGSNYVSARALAEAMGGSVAWDGKTSTIIVSSKAAVPTTPTVPTKSVYGIGDTATMNKLDFTVNGVRESTGSEYFKPADGKIYYIVDITIENKGSKPTNFSTLLGCKLYDSNAFNYTITFGPDVSGSIDGEIAAGRKVRGEVVFEIPEEVKGLELQLDPDLFASGSLIFKLDR